MLMTTAAICLAANIYFESRGEHMLGQLLVAQVTMNRAHQQKENVCNVVTASHQFSWTQGCIRPSKYGWAVLPACLPKEDFAWTMAKRVAHVALDGALVMLTCADHFFGKHATQPQWTNKMQRSLTFGEHNFYVSKAAKFACVRKS